jgi:superfamily II RNA helicase
MKICKKPYQTTLSFAKIFNEWSFSLSNFQKYAIEGIVKNKNILVTAQERHLSQILQLNL